MTLKPARACARFVGALCGGLVPTAGLASPARPRCLPMASMSRAPWRSMGSTSSWPTSAATNCNHSLTTGPSPGVRQAARHGHEPVP
jgi:hypothetical protein